MNRSPTANFADSNSNLEIFLPLLPFTTRVYAMFLLLLLLLPRPAVRGEEAEAITACLARNGGGNANLDVWISCIESAKQPDHNPSSTQEQLELVDQAVTKTAEEQEPSTSVHETKLPQPDHNAVQEKLVLADQAVTKTIEEQEPLRNSAKMIYWLAFACVVTLLRYCSQGNRARVPQDPSTEILSLCKPLGFALATVFHELLQAKDDSMADKDLEDLLACAIRPAMFETLGDRSLEFTDSLVNSFAQHYRVMAAVRDKLHKKCSNRSSSEAGETCKLYEHSGTVKVESEKGSGDGETVRIEETIRHRLEVLKTSEEAANLMPMLHSEKSFRDGMDWTQAVDGKKDSDAGIQKTMSFSEVEATEAANTTEKCQSVLHVEESFEAEVDQAAVTCLQRQNSDPPDTDSLVEKMEQLNLRGENSVAEYRSSPLDIALHAFERSVAAQERSNHIKFLSLMQKEQFKAEKLSRMKQKMDMNESKFTFKKSVFEEQILTAGSSALCSKCADDFVTGLLVMGSYMAYCTWRNIPNWLADLRNTCMAELKQSSQTRSWNVMQWAYNVAEDNGRLWWCMLRGTGVFVAGGLLAVVVVMLVFRRLLSYPSQRMSSTIFLATGVFAGWVGRMCINLMGGDGFMWLLVWLLYCLCHAASNCFAVRLYKNLTGHPLCSLFFHAFLALLLPAFATFVAFPNASTRLL